MFVSFVAYVVQKNLSVRYVSEARAVSAEVAFSSSLLLLLFSILFAQRQSDLSAWKVFFILCYYCYE